MVSKALDISNRVTNMLYFLLLIAFSINIMQRRVLLCFGRLCRQLEIVG